MKRFLSLLLALLMVVSLVPLFVISTGAQGNADAAGFPQLVITEVVADSVNYVDGVNDWMSLMPDVFGTTPGLEVVYEPVSVKSGRAVTSYYTKVVNNNVVSFVKATGKSDGKTVYYAQKVYSEGSENYNNVFKFIEIYNAGDQPVNLYDYKIAYDAKGGTDGTSIDFVELNPGALQSSYRKDGFERVSLEYGQSLRGYYSYENGTYVKHTSYLDKAEMGGVYYRAVSDEYTVVPKHGIPRWA